MQKFIGMMTTEHKADRGIYITTSDFTKPAKRLARKHNIELWDGSKLANLLIEQRKKDTTICAEKYLALLFTFWVWDKNFTAYNFGYDAWLPPAIIFKSLKTKSNLWGKIQILEAL